MSKRVALSLVVVVVALLFSSAAFAENPAPVSKEDFLTSLQAPATVATPEAPAVTGLDQPAPVFKACTSQCQKCGTNRVRLCTLCNGVTSCEACHSGTVCSV